MVHSLLKLCYKYKYKYKYKLQVPSAKPPYYNENFEIITKIKSNMGTSLKDFSWNL